jgi:glycosyltransferase involved in cell wall biosynthesis
MRCRISPATGEHPTHPNSQPRARRLEHSGRIRGRRRYESDEFTRGPNPVRHILNGLSAAIVRARTRAEDRLRRSRIAGDTLAVAALLSHRLRRQSAVAPAGELPASLNRALRLAQGRRVRQALTDSVRVWASAARHGAVADTEKRPVRMSGSLIVKAPATNGEKGVLFAGNEGDLARLSASGLLPVVQQDYVVFALSAWSPPSPRTYSRIASQCRDPVHVGISHIEDLDMYGTYGPAVVPVNLMACDWLNPDDFVALPVEQRDIDMIMVAGWGHYKRHWVLFDALRSLPAHLRVVLVGGSSEGRTLLDVKRDAALWNVRQDIMFHEDLPISEVNRLQSAARLALQFSGREGACVAVTEAMMGGTPVGITADSHIGASVHINQATGRRLPRRNLSHHIRAMLDSAAEFAPRDWLLENACCTTSSTSLDHHLERHALGRREVWSTGIAPVFRRRQQMHYMDESQSVTLAEAVDDLYRLGVVLRGETRLLPRDPP